MSNKLDQARRDLDGLKTDLKALAERVDASGGVWSNDERGSAETLVEKVKATRRTVESLEAEQRVSDEIDAIFGGGAPPARHGRGRTGGSWGEKVISELSRLGHKALVP